jgi:thymidine phosphorylase
MLMAEVIRRKRDGGELTPATISEIIAGVVGGGVPDYQAAALLMAVYFRGLTDAELVAWTQAMLHSGDVFDLSHLPGGKVDKHSTGGVGDKISIPLAPLVAACGVKVPMISGRGLGHTGGTLDKLESIPLIAASILSKKLAEGISGLVLDVKVGSGAFMKTRERALGLARTLVGLGNRSGVKTVAYLTDMNEPIGWAVGNALEIEESIEVLRGEGPADTVDLVVTLGGRMLVLGGATGAQADGEARIRGAIADGSGLEVFRRMVAFQGGDVGVVDDFGRLPRASASVDVVAPVGGTVQAIDCEGIGLAALVLGGGRRTKEDAIDPAVGLRMRVRLGAEVKAGEPLATLLVNDVSKVPEATALVRDAYIIGEAPVSAGPRVLEVVE